MRRITFLFVILLAIGGCSPDLTSPKNGRFETGQPTSYDYRVDRHDMQPHARDTNKPEAKTLALLLPLTGKHADIGQGLLNAAQLALFDMNDPTITLIPIDTKGTPYGAEIAAKQAIQKNAQLIIGPLLADSVRKAGGVASRYNRPLIGFTTDARMAGGNVFTMGILPGDQGTRLARYAADTQLNRIIVIDPQTDYTDTVLKGFKNTAQDLNLEIVQTITVSSSDNMEFVARRIAAVKGQFDTIFMPLSDPQLSDLASHLIALGLNANIVPWVGTGLWDDPSVTQNNMMRGAVFSAPPTMLRQDYESQYLNAYDAAPPRLSSLAYDATALGIILLKQTPSNRSVAPQMILNPNGFSGIDGIFRFQNNRRAERGLAIHRIIGQGQTSVISNAPRSFVPLGE